MGRDIECANEYSISLQGRHRKMSETNRRDFLKASALAAGALATELALQSGVHAEGKDVIKIGLVGCGGRGSGAVGDCLEADPAVKLVALGDVFEDRAK